MVLKHEQGTESASASAKNRKRDIERVNSDSILEIDSHDSEPDWEICEKRGLKEALKQTLGGVDEVHCDSKIAEAEARNQAALARLKKSRQIPSKY